VKAIFISDVHLRDISESNSSLLLLFFSSIAEDPSFTHLFLVGDIFDLWIGNHTFFIERFRPIINAIKKCTENTEVHYFEGNHDLYLKSYWQNTVGVTVHEEPKNFQLGSWNVRVEHGDQMNPEDRGYLWLRWFLRTPLIKVVQKILPGALIHRIGARASQVSEHHRDPWSNETSEKIVAFTRRHAEKVSQTNSFQWMISGHTHVKDHFEFLSQGKKRVSINLGSWANGPVCFLLDEEQGVFLDKI